MIGNHAFKQPHEFNIPPAFLFQFAGRSDAVQVAINKEFQQIGGVVGRPAFRSNLDGKVKVVEMDAINKQVNQADFIAGINGILHCNGKKMGLFPVVSLYKVHT